MSLLSCQTLRRAWPRCCCLPDRARKRRNRSGRSSGAGRVRRCRSRHWQGQHHRTPSLRHCRWLGAPHESARRHRPRLQCSPTRRNHPRPQKPEHPGKPGPCRSPLRLIAAESGESRGEAVPEYGPTVRSVVNDGLSCRYA